MIPPKLQKWIDKEVFPQRILLSGGAHAIEVAIEIARQLQGVDRTKIESGIHSDTIVFRDNGKSFKIDWSDAAKKDDQGEHENVRGLIRWAHQKPVEGKYRIVILENLERLTNDSPHACLKLIEEPPLRTIFLFTTRNHHHQRLLDTILSRVTVVRLPHTDAEEIPDEDAVRFCGASNLIDRFQIIDDLDKKSKDNKEKKIDRTVFLQFLTHLIQHERNAAKASPHLELLSESYQAIQQNINPKLVLERLSLKTLKR